MAIDLQKINVKFYLAEDATLRAEEAFRAFSQWIPETTDEVLVDVADYDHVPQGPKTVLVGHEANYTLDNSDGRYGLLYGQKTPATGSNTERLRAALAASLKACRRLEQTADSGSARFVGSEAVVIVNDRLRAANDDATFDQLRGDLDAVAAQLYGGASTQIEREGEARERLTIRVRATGDFDAATLLSNLGA